MLKESGIITGVVIGHWEKKKKCSLRCFPALTCCSSITETSTEKPYLIDLLYTVRLKISQNRTRTTGNNIKLNWKVSQIFWIPDKGQRPSFMELLRYQINDYIGSALGYLKEGWDATRVVVWWWATSYGCYA